MIQKMNFDFHDEKLPSASLATSFVALFLSVDACTKSFSKLQVAKKGMNKLPSMWIEEWLYVFGNFV